MKLIPTTLVAIGLLTPQFIHATVFTFDTSSSAGWMATAGGAVDATPFVVSGFGNAGSQKVLCITSSGGSAGSFLTGGSLANFDGYWTARYTFVLPSNAFNVQLNYSNLFQDDRGVLRLNGTIISSSGAVAPGGSLDGFMVFTDGGAPQPYTFAGAFGTVSGSVTSGFVGGVNTLDLIMNNTGTGLAGSLRTGLAPNDGTGFGLSVSVSYAVPEPSSSALILLGLGCAACCIRKSKMAVSGSN